MLVTMKLHATAEEIEAVCRKIESMGYRAHPIPGSTRTAIGITGNQGPVEAAAIEALPGVGECVPVSKPYKLVGRELKEETTIVDLGDGVRIGGKELAIIAGPCAVESREQTRAIAEGVAAAGARLFRGGAYKPRTSPYSFQGLEEDGLRILAEVRRDFGLKIVTEAIDVESMDLVERYGDGKPYQFQYDGAPTCNEQLLIARRLIEAGARVVSLSYGRWDSHSRNAASRGRIE